VREELRALDDRADQRGDRRQLLRHLPTEEAHAPVVRRNQTEKGTQRSGLAGPVRAEEAVDLPGLDHHVEAVKCLARAAPERAVCLPQPLYFEYGCQARPPP
jgi:hypothetical protein